MAHDNNKVNKNNVWTNETIDLLHKFTTSLNQQVDYKFAAHCVEVATKVYLMKLNTLYDDVNRLSSFLGKSEFKSKLKVRTRLKKLFLECPRRESSEKESDNQEQPANTQARRRDRLRRKTMVTKNVGILNARMETNAALNPFFGKLNSYIGELGRSDKMLLNLLPSHSGSFTDFKKHFWNVSDQVPLDENPKRSKKVIKYKELPDITSTAIRLTNANYEISNRNLDEFTSTA